MLKGLLTCGARSLSTSASPPSWSPASTPTTSGPNIGSTGSTSPLSRSASSTPTRTSGRRTSPGETATRPSSGTTRSTTTTRTRPPELLVWEKSGRQSRGVWSVACAVSMGWQLWKEDGSCIATVRDAERDNSPARGWMGFIDSSRGLASTACRLVHVS